MTKLIISDADVSLNGNRILHGLNLSIEEGEFLSLLGPSGCGKSTLLKTVAGINEIESGSIVLDGEEINDKPAYKRGAVIVFQDMRLFPNMSIAENVAYPLRIQGMGKAERLAKASEYLGYVKLEGLEDRKVYRLSGGQQQRVALARALAARPKLLLLDEPFSSLDENLREDMRRLVKDLHKQFKMTTIMVTHDRQEALSMADRVAIMFDGRIVQTGVPKELLDDPANEQVRKYFEDCIYVKGTVKNGVFTASDGSGLTCRMNRPDGEYEIMLSAGMTRTALYPPASLSAGTIEFE